MTTPPLRDPDLDQHLRRTLRAVAASVEVHPRPLQAATTASPPARWKARRRALLALVAAGTAAVTAAAVVRSGPEYVDHLPPDGVILTGKADGLRYWMVESFHDDNCGRPFTGVEVVAEDRNLIGQEWDTTGYGYGEVGRNGCGYDATAALADPARSFSGGTFVGDAFVAVYAVHPDVDAVRLTVGGSGRDIAVHRVDGAGYALLELPPGTTDYTVSLLDGDSVVPGSTDEKTVPDE